MAYDKKIIDEFEEAQTFHSLDETDKDVGTGLVGAPACGDVMRLQIKVDEEGRIIDAAVKTFGCMSAIAASSHLNKKIKGMPVSEAKKISNQQIADELGLPPQKIHCSVLAAEALEMAVRNIEEKRASASA